jgi:hypothetical protein
LQIRALRDYAARRGWVIVMQVKEVDSGVSHRVGRIHLVQDGRNIDQLDPQHLGLGSVLNTNVANRGLRHFTSAPP